MDSRVLDASAFYAGIPFSSSEPNFTTSLVYDEIQHIKKEQDAVQILIETKRLTVQDPEPDFLDKVKKIKLDLVITLGGDGTTLRTFRNLQNETPILTINVGGNRGILSEITLNEIDKALQSIKKNEIWLDKRTRVMASCDGKQFDPALNEIYINRKNLTKTAEFEIKFQNDTVKQKMDGGIISTPSGSTGHSLSIGGPVLHESLDVLIITPVGPVHRLPSIVVPDERIEVICSHDCNIVMDAQVIKSSSFDEPIIIKKYKKQAVFVRLKKKGLRQMTKLGF